LLIKTQKTLWFLTYSSRTIFLKLAFLKKNASQENHNRLDSKIKNSPKVTKNEKIFLSISKSS